MEENLEGKYFISIGFSSGSMYFSAIHYIKDTDEEFEYEIFNKNKWTIISGRYMTLEKKKSYIEKTLKRSYKEISKEEFKQIIKKMKDES